MRIRHFRDVSVRRWHFELLAGLRQKGQAGIGNKIESEQFGQVFKPRQLPEKSKR